MFAVEIELPVEIVKEKKERLEEEEEVEQQIRKSTIMELQICAFRFRTVWYFELYLWVQGIFQIMMSTGMRKELQKPDFKKSNDWLTA